MEDTISLEESAWGGVGETPRRPGGELVQCSLPLALRPCGQLVVMLAFQGPAWHVGNVPAKVLALEKGSAPRRGRHSGEVSAGTVPFEGGG